jgi:dynein heavy chain
VFGFPATEYAVLDILSLDFEPFYQLWTMLADFEESRAMWLNGPFADLDAPAVESTVNEWWRASYRLSKQLADPAPGSAEVALVVRERTAEFKQYLPVITTLASPALRARHWHELSAKISEKMGGGQVASKPRACFPFAFPERVPTRTELVV